MRMISVISIAAALLGGATLVRAQQVPVPPPSEDSSLSEIVVTGTSIRGVAPTGANLITLSRDQIAATGASSVQDALQYAPSLGNFGAPLAGGTNGGESFVPNIHGVGQGATLTLVDGLRLPGAGPLEQYADPSVIPLSAVERVEIVPDGASSIYGSDAVAGVVNVITRKAFNGVEAGVQYGGANHYHDINFDIAAGKTWDSGSALLAYEWRDRKPLEAMARSFARADQTGHGGGNYTSFNCSPATVQVGGVTYSGAGLLKSPAPGCDTGLTADLIPEQIRHSVFLSLHQDINSRVSIGLNTIFSEFKTTTRNDSGQQIGNATITSANPYFVAPPGTTATSESVSFNLDPQFGSRPISATTSTRNVTLMPNLTVDLGRGWKVRVDGSFGWEHDLLAQDGLDQSVAQAALAGTTLTTALNPYGFGPANNPAVLASINDGYQTRNGSSSELREGIVKVDGPVFSLPSGNVSLALGVDVRRESSTETESIGPPGAVLRISDSARDVESAFGEVFIPLVGPTENIPAVKSLNLSASGRFDHYTSFGNTSNPKVGLNWESVSGVHLRGSYGTSFQAPSLGDAAADTVDARVQYLPNYPYPFAPPGQIKNVLLVAGGNPNLKPQTATTYSFGLDINPPELKQLTLSATYFEVDYKNLIGEALTGTTYTNPAYAPFITFNPTAAQIAAFTSILPTVNYTPGVPVDILLDARRNNLGFENVGGIDYDLGYIVRLSEDSIESHFSGEYLTRYSQQPVAGAPAVSLLGTDNAIRSKFRGTVNWLHQNFNSMIAVNYTGNYVDPGVVRSTEHYTTCDVRAAYTLNNVPGVKSAELALLVQNVFDKDPPFFNAPVGFDTTVTNPIGRFIQLGVRVKVQ